MTSAIRKLTEIIEQQLDWGPSRGWQTRDFENLGQLIFDKTKVSLSESTLRRIWGRVEYKHLPSTTTLDTLAQFAGFENWRAFVKRHAGKTPPVQNTAAPVKRKLKFPLSAKAALIIAAFIIIAAVSRHFIKREAVDGRKYSFSSQRLTHDIPNTVIFDYDASASPTDSIYIQQSWDPKTRTLIKKDAHQFTSVYYEPGFYQAKLVIGKKVVREHKLMIPTGGWLGLIEDRPVPVYLNPQDFIKKDMLNVPAATIRQKNMSMQPKPTLIKYYNVGNFEPVPVSDFSFSAEIKNGYREGEAACQFTGVSLITDSGPIIIPLSIKGCVSELTLISVDWVISGKTANLSGFGIDMSDWVKVSCKSTAKTVKYFVNDKQAFEFQLPSNRVKIIGIGFAFQGTGGVRHIELKGHDQVVFKAF